MKTKLLFYCLTALCSVATGYSQTLNGRLLEVPTVGGNGEVAKVDMYDRDCLHVVDGVISSYNDIVPNQQLAHFERAVSREKLAELGFSDGQCVIIKSTADIDLENYIYRQVNEQVRQVGIQYKIPIAVNGKLITSYADRQRQLSTIKPAQVKQVTFLSKPEAQAKYGDKVVFGLIEITL